VSREAAKQRFVGRIIPLVLASFALAFAGVLVIDLYIEHRQIEASTRIAGTTISILSTVSDFRRAVHRFDEAAERGAPEGGALAALQAAQAGLDAGMQGFTEHIHPEARRDWLALRERIAALEGSAPLVEGTRPEAFEPRVAAIEDDLSAVNAIVDRRGLAALASAERLHTLEGALEACVLFSLAAASAALLFGWRRQEALARSRDARIEMQLHRTLEELDGFAGRVAHDLRTPLTPILVSSQWIEHAPVTDSVRSQAERIERAARRLGRMIDALLLYTRAGAGGALEGARTAVNAAIEEIIADFDEPARARRARLEMDFGPPVTVSCAPEVVQSLVANLVDNALKYATTGDAPTRIVVRTRLLPRFCVLEVEDDGPGIPAEQRARVFEPFFRGRQGGPGLGLGLSIVRRLVEAHGGRIEVLSGEHGGALFRILLPIAPAPRDAAAIALRPPT
jgi:signal transduction histidine kinase